MAPWQSGLLYGSAKPWFVGSNPTGALKICFCHRTKRTFRKKQSIPYEKGLKTNSGFFFFVWFFFFWFLHIFWYNYLKIKIYSIHLYKKKKICLLSYHYLLFHYDDVQLRIIKLQILIHRNESSYLIIR